MTVKRVASEVVVNKTVSWLNSRAFWPLYIGLVLVSWLGISALTDDAGMAWSYVHLLHGVITYYYLHWSKGSIASEDQGKYSLLTFWEQIDNQAYGTHTRKFFTLVPVVLFVLAMHGTDFRKQPLGLNLVVVLVLLIAKLPALHKVRIFGINRY
ncbi:MAG: hypothetical protein WDW38_000575 [Sanguina aurantia]